MVGVDRYRKDGHQSPLGWTKMSVLLTREKKCWREGWGTGHPRTICRQISSLQKQNHKVYRTKTLGLHPMFCTYVATAVSYSNQNLKTVQGFLGWGRFLSFFTVPGSWRVTSGTSSQNSILFLMPPGNKKLPSCPQVTNNLSLAGSRPQTPDLTYPHQTKVWVGGPRSPDFLQIYIPFPSMLNGLKLLLGWKMCIFRTQSHCSSLLLMPKTTVPPSDRREEPHLNQAWEKTQMIRLQISRVSYHPTQLSLPVAPV